MTGYYRIALFILLMIAFFKGEKEILIFLFVSTVIFEQLVDIRKKLEEK